MDKLDKMDELDKLDRLAQTGGSRAENPKKARLRRVWLALACCAVFAAGIGWHAARGAGFSVPDRILICLDPGHGGSDPGAVWEGRQEKDDTLALALAVSRALEERGLEDLTVMFTRQDDRTLTLQERVEAANQAGATLFVSIHRNSGGGRGVETWVSAGADRAETRLAGYLQSALVRAGVSRNRGVKKGTAADPKASYFVLSNTEMPACLVELGFVDSEADNDLLDRQLDDYALAIAQGILRMVNK